MNSLLIEYKEYYNIALAFSIVLMVLLLLILSSRKFRSTPGTYWLIVIFHLLFYYLLTLFMNYGWFENMPLFIALRNLIPVAFGPFLFVLSANYLKTGFKWDASFLRYFAVLIIMTLGIIPYFFYLNNHGSSFLIQYSKIYNFLLQEISALGFILVPIWAYSKLSLIRNNHLGGKPISIKFKGVQYKFLHLLMFLILSHGIIWFIEINIRGLSIHISELFGVINQIYFLILGYIFVYLFLNFPASIYESKLEFEVPEKDKYKHSKLDRSEALYQLNRMNEYMITKKPYLDSELSIQELSKSMELPVNLISEIINNIVNQNFYDYVNNFRVEEFKLLANEPANNHLKILALAYEAGFKSKTTFNTTFKKITGQTPSEYIQQIRP